MPNHWDKDVICPFFKRSMEKNITCEGITDGCTTHIEFNSRNKKRMHTSIFCEKKYENCEIYRMLIKKYD